VDRASGGRDPLAEGDSAAATPGRVRAGGESNPGQVTSTALTATASTPPMGSAPARVARARHRRGQVQLQLRALTQCAKESTSWMASWARGGSRPPTDRKQVAEDGAFRSAGGLSPLPCARHPMPPGAGADRRRRSRGVRWWSAGADQHVGQVCAQSTHDGS